MAGFPSPGALSKFVSFHMEVPLSTITGQGGLSDQVFDVIVWAEARGRLFELVEKAVRDNQTMLISASSAKSSNVFDWACRRSSIVACPDHSVVLLEPHVARDDRCCGSGPASGRNLLFGCPATDVERLVTAAAKEGWLLEFYDQNRPARADVQKLRQEVASLNELKTTRLQRDA